jgi:DNA-binding NarL/FixJ family response regulator
MNPVTNQYFIWPRTQVQLTKISGCQLRFIKIYVTLSNVKQDVTGITNITNEQEKITILLVDDHYIVRHALNDVLSKQPDMQVIGEAVDGEEAVRLAAELKPRLIIIDISMPKLNGLEATQRIKAASPEIAVLVLTIHTEDEYILKILQFGAAGYLTKTVFGNEIVEAIRSVVAGEMVLAQEIGKKLIQAAVGTPIKPRPSGWEANVSSREMEVLRLAARGKCNKEISTELDISLRTVKGHLAAIFYKLKVGSRTEAVITGLRVGILSLQDLE